MSEASAEGSAAIEMRIAALRARLERAAARSPNAAPRFQIVAVSKRHPAAAITAARDAGHRDFGENYALEMVEKASALGAGDALRWHFIGQLQRNKVSKVVGVAAVIHAVDSERLLREIAKRAASAEIRQAILVAVSLAGEAQKSGLPPSECAVLLELAEALPSIECLGLMTMPPLATDPEASRVHFAALRRMRDELATPGQPLADLSMGTTADCEVAVEEGATLVRVGTAIFGPRASNA